MGAPEDPVVTRSELARLHRHLLDRSALLAPTNVDAILDLGTAVVLHGLLEPGLTTGLTSLIDESVVAQLAEEHDRLSDDLQLLESLWTQERNSPDLADLSGALLDRLRRHVGRDQRLYYDAQIQRAPHAPGSRMPRAR